MDKDRTKADEGCCRHRQPRQGAWATGRSCEGKYGREEGPEGPIILELKY